jgi:4-amino-4-deoxy-L-arabinose transferase-like glycosyltransferase
MPASVPPVGAVLMALIFMYATTSVGTMIFSVPVGGMELAAAAMIVLAGGGLAWPIVSRLAPPSMPRNFVAVCAAALGLWILSTLMLLLGSLGLLHAWLWWSILLLGVLAAGWAARGRLSRESTAGSTADGRALIWVVCGAAVGMWLGGALHPPGLIDVGGDAYDVLEYHLQLPREFYNGGGIRQLTHNVYSHYPLGVEMLSLMAMCLRGGAYEGMYLATLLHGAFGALAVVGVILGLRDGEDSRGRISGALLATCPIVIYLSWLAFSELAMICYLALGLIWLRAWLREARWQTAAGIGCLLGAACAAKYLSVGFVAGPVLAVVLVASVRSGQRLGHMLLVGVLALGLFSPWLVRNAVLTGNPVFPLATDVLGQGYWTDMQAHRWRAGHAPIQHPPVPEPPGWAAREAPGTLEQFWGAFVISGTLNTTMVFLAVVSICALVSMRNSLRTYRWEYALVGVTVLQAGAWATATRGMPVRFIAPAVVPVALLAGWGLARLAAVKYNPLKKRAAETDPPGWGRVATIAILLAALITGVTAIVNLFSSAQRFERPVPPLPADEVLLTFPDLHASRQLPEGSRLALIGEARAFYYPPDTLYATAFDTHPLDMPDATPEEYRRRVRDLGVTHLFVNWFELRRLAATYGVTPTFTEGLYNRWQQGQPPSLPLLEALNARPVPFLVTTDDGLVPVPGTTYRPDVPKPKRTEWRWKHPPVGWPVLSVYAIPPVDAPSDWQPEPIIREFPDATGNKFAPEQAEPFDASPEPSDTPETSVPKATAPAGQAIDG